MAEKKIDKRNNNSGGGGGIIITSTKYNQTSSKIDAFTALRRTVLYLMCTYFISPLLGCFGYNVCLLHLDAVANFVLLSIGILFAFSFALREK